MLVYSINLFKFNKLYFSLTSSFLMEYTSTSVKIVRYLHEIHAYLAFPASDLLSLELGDFYGHFNSESCVNLNVLKIDNFQGLSLVCGR